MTAATTVEIIATAGEGFTRRWSAKRSARRVFPDVKPAVVKDNRHG